MVQKTNGPALSLHANTWVFLYTNISRALGIFRGTAAWLAGALQRTADRLTARDLIAAELLHSRSGFLVP